MCADDFAISPGTSKTIARLAKGKCINAVSCMAASPHWSEVAPLLDGVEEMDCGDLGPIQIGLHLVLATEKPLGPMSCVDGNGHLPGPDRLLAMVISGLIKSEEFNAEIDRQFEAFKFERGHAPDFVDAHQHVHVYPVIRNLVIAATKRHAPDAWVRVPTDRLAAMTSRPFPGKAMGSAVHCLGFRSALAKNGLRSNSSFAGHYDFGEKYEDYLPRFFDHRSSFHLIMCHPGTDEMEGDAIATARVNEADIIGRATLAERVSRFRSLAAA